MAISIRENHLSSQNNLLLHEWYQTSLGQELAQAVSLQLEHFLQHLFGYHLLQVGLPFQTDWLDASVIKHRFTINDSSTCFLSDACVELPDLPIANESVDVVFMPHTLETWRDPTAMLQEVDRVLVPHGYMLILGINPMSLWGIKHLLSRKHQQVPWHSHLHSCMRLRKTVYDMGYAIRKISSFYYQYPFDEPENLKKWRFLHTVGNVVWPYPGGLYLLLAQKKVAHIMPIKPLWKVKNFFTNKTVAEPAPD